MTAEQPRLGDMLVRAGLISELQLKTALSEQRRWGGKLGTVLVRMGALAEDMLVLALSQQLGLPRADLSHATIPDVLRERLEERVCATLNVFPLAYLSERRTVQVALADPFNLAVIDDLQRRLNLKVEVFLAGEQQIVAALKRAFGKEELEVSDVEDDEISIVDNLGQALGSKPGATSRTAAPPSAPMPGAAARVAPAAPPPRMPTPAEAPRDAPLAARIATHHATVAAVRDLLVARGIGGPPSGPRHR